MFRYLIITLICIFSFNEALRAQDQEAASDQKEKSSSKNNMGSFKDRVYFGGNFGLWFSDSYSYVELSPVMGYRITPKLSSGAGIIYQYIRRKYYYSNGDDLTKSTNVYGGKVFARMDLFQPVFAYAEFEDLSYEYYNPYLNRFKREWVPGLFLGGGVMQPFGRKGGIGIMLLYNVLFDSQKSPYNDAFVYRISFFI